MRPLAAMVAMGVLAAAGPACGCAAETYPLPAGVRALVTTPAHLQAFAQPLAADVERQLAAVPAPDGEKLTLLLALRVHLALLTGDAPRALDSAARIRARQAGEIEQAYAGLTTEATVAARQEAKAVGADFAAVFRAAFARALATLPRSPAATALLAQQRDRIRGMTREALLAEADRLAAKVDATGRCSLADADQIIRIGHRLENIVPLRDTMLAAFDAEIAARGNGR